VSGSTARARRPRGDPGRRRGLQTTPDARLA